MSYDEAFATLEWYINNEMGSKDLQICLEALDVIRNTLAEALEE